MTTDNPMIAMHEDANAALAEPAEHRGTFLHFGDGRVKMGGGSSDGVPSLCLEVGEWGAQPGERRDGPPSQYWTKPGDVVLTFKNLAGIDALLAELALLRVQLVDRAAPPSA